jgi:two-component system nitrate/nitrite sensor histidine kinase NarX
MRPEIARLRQAIFSQSGVRLRTGLIFFAGLILLIGATVVASMLASRATALDAEIIRQLSDLSAQTDQWMASSSVPPPDLETTLQMLLQGGLLPRPGRQPLSVPPADDEGLISALKSTLAVWDQYRALSAKLAEQPNDAALQAQLLDRKHELSSGLAQVTYLVRLRHESSTGMVRGMFASLFFSSLVFLLIGLWFTGQIVIMQVEALDAIANRIAAGDLDTPVTLDGQGEFIALANSFEKMRLELRQSREQLTRWMRDLEQHVAERTQQVTALSQVIAAASHSLELDTVLKTALEQVLQVMNAETGGLWLVDEATGHLGLAVPHGMSERMRSRIQVLEMMQGATGRAAATGQIITIENISLASGIVTGASIEEGLQSLIAVPIKSRDRVLGVLDVMTHQPRTFTPEEIALLTSVGQQIGIAVDSLRLMDEVRQQSLRVAALQERERIGIELHDGLLQTLGYLYLKIDQLEGEAAGHSLPKMAQELAAYREVLERASRDARRFIADLRETPPPPPAPLETALRDMIAEFAPANTLEIDLKTDGSPLLLSSDQCAHLVRIAREALINAARHGQARHATLLCTSYGSQGELSVQDDGNGFDMASPSAPDDGREHFGLSIMQARAASLGGRLSVESSPGQGTRVCICWPLAASQEHVHG